MKEERKGNGMNINLNMLIAVGIAVFLGGILGGAIASETGYISIPFGILAGSSGVGVIVLLVIGAKYL